MLNYYQQLDLDASIKGEPLQKKLIELQKKWIGKQNAPDLRRRQEAEGCLNLLTVPKKP